MNVVWSNGSDGPNPDGAELDWAVEDVVLRWWSGNSWAVPAADVPADVWPQLQLAGGLTLDGQLLPQTKPA